MTDLAGPFARVLAESYGFEGRRLLVDVGGGDGTMVAALLAAAPSVRAVLLELPHVAAKARRRPRLLRRRRWSRRYERRRYGRWGGGSGRRYRRFRRYGRIGDLGCRR